MKSVKSFYDQVAQSYDRNFQHKVALTENALATQDLPASNVLDLGCGTGLHLEYCQPDRYVGLDISAEMIKAARTKFPQATFIQADMAMIPLPDASVDSVVSLFGAFSYCLMPHRCVDEIYRVLRPEGTAVIMAMGQRYITRQRHIAHGLLPFWTYSGRQLKHLFSDFSQQRD